MQQRLACRARRSTPPPEKRNVGVGARRPRAPAVRAVAELLASAAKERRGPPTVSTQLEEALRPIDRAALSLGRKLDAAENSTPVANRLR